MNAQLVSYYIGIFIVFASHVWLLVQSNRDNAMLVAKCGADIAKASADVVVAHAGINLLAGSLIAYYFLTKEKYI